VLLWAIFLVDYLGDLRPILSAAARRFFICWMRSATLPGSLPAGIGFFGSWRLAMLVFLGGY
jgi:hypothetical protein